MAKQKTYSSKRLILRALILRDFKVWCLAQKNSLPSQSKWDRDPTPPESWSLKTFKETVLRYRQDAKEDRMYIWTLFSKKTGEIVGWIDITTICRGAYQMANLGYFIFNNHRGQGYAVEAVKGLIPHLFKDLKYHRLEAMTDLDNLPSIKTAKKCGLFEEGIKKHYWLDDDGVWQDQAIFIATPELYKYS